MDAVNLHHSIPIFSHFCTQYLGAVSISLYPQQETFTGYSDLYTRVPNLCNVSNFSFARESGITKETNSQLGPQWDYPNTSLADRVVGPVYSRWWILGSNIVAQVVLLKHVAAGPRESLSSSIFLFHLVGSEPLAIISCNKLHALAFAQLGILVRDIGILNCSIKKCKLAFWRSWDGVLHNKK